MWRQDRPINEHERRTGTRFALEIVIRSSKWSSVDGFVTERPSRTNAARDPRRPITSQGLSNCSRSLDWLDSVFWRANGSVRWHGRCPYPTDREKVNAASRRRPYARCGLYTRQLRTSDNVRGIVGIPPQRAKDARRGPRIPPQRAKDARRGPRDCSRGSTSCFAGARQSSGLISGRARSRPLS